MAPNPIRLQLARVAVLVCGDQPVPPAFASFVFDTRAAMRKYMAANLHVSTTDLYDDMMHYICDMDRSPEARARNLAAANECSASQLERQTLALGIMYAATLLVCRVIDEALDRHA